MRLTELKFISPLLDNFAAGGAISDHHGIRCYPAINEATGDKYIVKVISIPPSRTQLDAFLLSGAYADEASALVYFKEQAEDVVKEAEVLEKLSQLEGFYAYDKTQTVATEDDVGLQVYLLGSYKQTLERALQKQPMTHLGAVNLGLDLCAALTVCRRSGYLYVDLKPSNIFIASDNSYRIGDIGFQRLDSLVYASLPDKYRSAYTAPEIADAFSSLNTTIDVYAVGRILYQIYNNGELPLITADNAQEPLAAPANADYEMSEIILKACSPDPAERWEDPAQMGQALVSYMQRNGANDVPIVPPVVPVADMEEPEDVPVENAIEDVQEVAEAAEATAEDAQANVPPVIIDEDLGNLSALLQPSDDETAPEYNETDVDYDDVSPEINEILAQADEIANHPVPEPPVAPEPIDVPIPEPIAPEEESSDEEADATEDEVSDESSTEDTSNANANEDSAAVAVTTAETTNEDTEEGTDDDIPEEDEPVDAQPVKKKSNWLLYVILVLLLLGLITVGVYFYQNYYLLPIEAMTVEGKEDYLTVTVETPVDESLLTVVCKGQHGDVLTAPLKNGTVTFTDLKDDTGYVITVTVSGFHKLTGETTKGYSTPKVTNIASFDVYTGSVSGSVNVVFSVTGKDADGWQLTCSATGESTRKVSLQSKNETVSGLTVGKEYTFTLEPTSELYLTGENTIKLVVQAPAHAQYLAVDSCKDGKMTVSWLSPKDFDGSWTVTCADSTGSYSEVVTVTDTNATFEGVDNAKEYTITATAEGMQSGVTITKEANAPTLTNVNLSASLVAANITWDCEEDLGKWLVSYCVDGMQIGNEVAVEKNEFLIEGLVPGSNYCITIKTEDGIIPLGGTKSFATNEATEFSCTYQNKTVTAKDMTFQLCTPPDPDDWSLEDLASDGSDFTTEFKSGEAAGIVIQLTKERGSEEVNYTRVFAIYDEDNNLVEVSSSQNVWYKMWPKGKTCELTIPKMPQAAGEYSLHLFFNGQLVTTQQFTIIN